MNKKPITEEILNIRYSDIDFVKNLKLASLLNFFQDIASDNAEKYGFGYSYIYPKNLMWVLLKYRIEFSEYPVDNQTLKLTTEPRGCNKLFAYRNFNLKSGDKIISKASSMWGLVNVKTKEMVNAENVLSGSTMDKFIPNETDLRFNKIPAITNVDYEDEFKVRYNDIDVNMHANNSNYIIWGLEPLPYDFRKQNKLKNIDMVFKREIKLGEKMYVKVQIVDNISIHLLKNSLTDEDLCHIKCEWI